MATEITHASSKILRQKLVLGLTNRRVAFGGLRQQEGFTASTATHGDLALLLPLSRR